ncbi:HAD-IIB family hydrolase [Pseudoalteromonas sp. SSDWG2]|uniref:HAD-IIB family hydrolase n=1 Tax=Pseudoalteromonas sp. SSDWG2 TaxID=3139391 RepID=UPI003BAD780E
MMDFNVFLTEHQLGSQYTQQINQYFEPLAKQLIANKPKEKPLFVVINGAQGSGKSTLAEFIAQYINSETLLNACACSIDDFYLPRSKRLALAQDLHPLFATRGVPGTHDIPLLRQVLDKVFQGKAPIAIPRFDKAHDDRVSAEQWQQHTHAVDVFILEGWCVGTPPQGNCALAQPINDLESTHDGDGSWRRCVNSCLANEYQEVFNLADIRIMLKAPSFDAVLAWRWQQEQKLIAKVGHTEKTMTKEQVADFISYFERLTRHSLIKLPHMCEVVFELDAERNITTYHNALPSKGAVLPVIFTDLDGTLLDHHTYKCDEALPLLTQLEQAGVPVVINSSKTAAEIIPICQKLNIHDPFIAENGAVLYIPKNWFSSAPEGARHEQNYWVVPFSPQKATFLKVLEVLKAHFGDYFSSFTELGLEGVGKLTGLEGEALALAFNREYSEPLYWQGDAMQLREFSAAVKAMGYDVLKGGRFVHLTQGADKGVALRYFMGLMQQQYNRPLHSIALGDSHNDAAMLEAADTAIVIANPSNKTPILSRECAIFSVQTGPRGWQETLQGLALIKDQLTASEVREYG